MFAPASRTSTPRSIISSETGQAGAFHPGTTTARLQGNGSRLILDFGLEVGGIATVRYTVIGGAERGALGLAFSEAKDWAGEWSDASNGAFRGPDGAIYSNFSAPGDVVYTMPDDKLRVFKWTGRNEYVALCEPEYISFGGGCVILHPF